MSNHIHITEALEVLVALGFPRGQRNERSALTLLCLLNVTTEKAWSQAEAPLMGITPIMDWARDQYQKEYAPNSRETVRRFTMHQFLDAGIAVYNPDKPSRPINSPQTVYQVEPITLKLLRCFGTDKWKYNLRKYLSRRRTLSEKYARIRKQNLVPVQMLNGKTIELTPGKHSELIKAIIEDFAPRFAPGSRLVYAGDTGAKWGYFDADLLSGLGVAVDSHGKMPDVILRSPERNRVLLVEAATSHGPVDGKRREELAYLFNECKSDLVYVSAFPTRATMVKYLGVIAWETEVWIADAPSHMIHFNGDRFLGTS